MCITNFFAIITVLLLHTPLLLINDIVEFHNFVQRAFDTAYLYYLSETL